MKFNETALVTTPLHTTCSLKEKSELQYLGSSIRTKLRSSKKGRILNKFVSPKRLKRFKSSLRQRIQCQLFRMKNSFRSSHQRTWQRKHPWCRLYQSKCLLRQSLFEVSITSLRLMLNNNKRKFPVQLTCNKSNQENATTHLKSQDNEWWHRLEIMLRKRPWWAHKMVVLKKD